MRFKKIIRMFENGNVCITGLRGTGKDLLMSNVVVRRKDPYVSNIDYGGFFAPLDFDKISLGENTYQEFISGNVFHYEFPYARGSDIYISDVGVYLPSQYCNELNRDYKYLPAYMALSRQVSHNNFHINVQNLNRAWDKIREQSDIYILCRKCFYFKGFVLQFITIYDKYQSAVDRQKPLRLPMPLFSNKETRMLRRIQLAQYEAAHGTIDNRILLYRNRSSYNTRQFNEILKGGSHENKKISP